MGNGFSLLLFFGEAQTDLVQLLLAGYLQARSPLSYAAQVVTLPKYAIAV
ncbi:hypothetical protein ACFWF7_17560 [Nocardia sp. NPDC060256]